jgi:hypothetical protein
MRSARARLYVRVYALYTFHLVITWIKLRLSIAAFPKRAVLLIRLPKQVSVHIRDPLSCRPLCECPCRIWRFACLLLNRTKVRSSISLESHSQLMSFLVTSENVMVFPLHFAKYFNFYNFSGIFLRFSVFSLSTFWGLKERFRDFKHTFSEVSVIFIIHSNF